MIDIINTLCATSLEGIRPRIFFFFFFFGLPPTSHKWYEKRSVSELYEQKNQFDK